MPLPEGAITYHTINDKRERWGDGPWVNEPDKVQWVDAETDLDCLLHRHPESGHWCGYVGVTKGHPAFGVEYTHVDVNVHGGLTYSAYCRETGNEALGVCHVPLPGRDPHVWWLGFDCAHAHDLSPAMKHFRETNEVLRHLPRTVRERYWTTEAVCVEASELARELLQCLLQSKVTVL